MRVDIRRCQVERTRQRHCRNEAGTRESSVPEKCLAPAAGSVFQCCWETRSGSIRRPWLCYCRQKLGLLELVGVQSLLLGRFGGMVDQGRRRCKTGWGQAEAQDQWGRWKVQVVQNWRRCWQQWWQQCWSQLQTGRVWANRWPCGRLRLGLSDATGRREWEGDDPGDQRISDGGLPQMVCGS